ncbi:MAG: phosphoribosylglycinamide formyltransferase, partial [Clostridia bacterium]|nr:phosphoribosylglycinamide formyltransferase [Clostridia bacterium]
MKKTKIAVFCSGGGTNLQALIDAQNSGVIKSGEIRLVLANSPSAFALTRAKNAGIPTAVVTKKQTGSQAAFEREVKRILQENGIELIVL